MLFGGSAGGGKTKALLIEALIQMLETPGNHGVIMRRSFPELEKTVIMESFKLFPGAICKYNEIKHRWTIKTNGPDSHLSFGFCKTESDVYQHQGAEYGFLGLDESTHFSYNQFTYLLSRVRSSIPGSWPRIRCCSNPGNIGHGWHKQYFGILTQVPGVSFTPPPSEDDAAPLSRMFIPAGVRDNPYLMQNDPTYIQRLQLLPPTQRRMLLDGDWSSFSGKFFTEIGGDHFCAPFAVPPHWKRWRCVDYGFQAPFCCLWVAQDPIDQTFYVYREMYMTQLRDQEQAQWVKKASEGELFEYTIGDPSMSAKRGGTGQSPMEAYMNEGVPVLPGDNKRVHGWMAMRNLFALRPDGKPRMRIFNSCKNLRRELDEAITDDHCPEDINTDGEDHALDALRYFCMSRPEPSVEPKKDPYAHMDDATRREWAAVRKLQERHATNANRATLHEFNREVD